MSKDYWKDRVSAAQAKKSQKTIKEIEKQLQKYYKTAMNNAISDFESTYDKLLATIAKGEKPTPADLYKLDKYWKMQGQLKKELQKLGDKQAALLSKKFESNFFDVYNSFSKESLPVFSTIDKEAAQQMINQIWCADGKTWSQRIWDNISYLTETLNEELINCVVAGRKTSELKKILQERFDVSYKQADTLARTEIAHIQTQAAEKRYKDAGVEEVQIWADKDERRCDVCGKLHQKKYPIGAKVPIPAHPNCRCCIIPVVKI